MKKLLLMVVFTVGLTFPSTAQVTQDELDKAKQEVKKAKKDKKAKEDAYQALVDSAMYQNAIYSIENQDFVLEAERITFKRGNWRYVTSNTNFISLKDGKATVQIAFIGAPPGPNGIGGITVEGLVSNVKTQTDKKGNMHFSMNVMGNGISAMITITLPKDSHWATATVSPNFSSNRFILNGILWPTSQSEVFKGRVL